MAEETNPPESEETKTHKPEGETEQVVVVEGVTAEQVAEEKGEAFELGRIVAQNDQILAGQAAINTRLDGIDATLNEHGQRLQESELRAEAAETVAVAAEETAEETADAVAGAVEELAVTPVEETAEENAPKIAGKSSRFVRIGRKAE